MPNTQTAVSARMTFENLIVHDGNREAARLAIAFADRWPDVKKGLLFMGPPGTGKTHLAAAIHDRIGGTWVNANQLIADLRPGGKIQQAKAAAEKCFGECHGHCGVRLYGSRPTGACRYCHVVSGAVLPGISDAPLLFLDDLGTHKPSDWAAEIIYSLLDERLGPVVATTNYSLEELADRLGHDRIVSRLCGLAHVQHVSGDDWRVRR